MIKNLLHSKFAKSTSIYTISKFINSGIPFFLLPILTRYLSTEEYGQLSMFNATTSFLTPFVGMSIGSAIQRKIVEGNERESKEYVFNSLIIFAISTIVVFLMFIIFFEQVSKYTTIPKSLFPYIMITAASTCLFSTTLSFFQIREQPKMYAVLQNMCTLSNVGLSIFFVVGLGMKLSGRVYGITYSILIYAIISFGILYKYIKGNNNRINIPFITDEVFNFAIPLIPTEIKAIVFTYMDRIFLTNMINVATTGVYSLGNQVSLPILFFEQAFNLAFVPWLYRKLEENNEVDKRKIVKMTYIYFIIVPIIAVVWSLLARPLIEIITDTGYEDAHLYVIWLSLGYALNGMHMMVVNYIFYVKKLNLYAVATVIVMAMNIILNYVLIKKDGSIGAAEATLICNFVSFALTWILSMRVCPMPWFDFL